MSWWLPQNHSATGVEIDRLFLVIFVICAIVMLLVFLLMGIFLWRYRHRENQRATYTHGNTRMEMAWTITPAVILLGLAVWSTKVWDRYRIADAEPPADAAKILVIGQQFKWNIVYPGPDGKFGRYLVFPKDSDAKWPDGSKFMNYTGPRDVPAEQVQSVIGQYIDQVDPLGKDFDDPDGKDDDWKSSLGRAMDVPFGRPVQILLTSKDVIHSFSIPEFRVKLDALPGMMGTISLTPVGDGTLSSDRAKLNRQRHSLDEIAEMLKNPANADVLIAIDESDKSEGAESTPAGWRFATTDSHHHKVTIMRDGMGFFVSDDPKRDTISRLKAIGVKSAMVYRPGYYDIVCQQLCGQGHYTMQGEMYVISDQEYAEKYEGKK
ncbi:MAG TPA: cytochrome c oxidase subunit II transmembrane domain-containing protein [Tepidisphaeraceae bacterium]|jgi:cytochrome c oxidase subunit 2